MDTSRSENGGPVMIAHYVLSQGATYLLTYTDTPSSPNDSEQQLEARHDQGQERSLRYVNATLVRQAKIRLHGKYSGREFEGDLPDRQRALRARYYIVGNRIYQLMVAGRGPLCGRTPPADSSMRSP